MNEPSLQEKYEAAVKMIIELHHEIAALKSEVDLLRTYKWMYEELQ